MTTLFHMSVEKSRKRPAELPPEARAFDVLKSRLPPDAVALAVADWPGIVICHKGRAFGLQMKLPGIPLTLAQTNAVIAMRGAGMRVDIAQGPVRPSRGRMRWAWRSRKTSVTACAMCSARGPGAAHDQLSARTKF